MAEPVWVADSSSLIQIKSEVPRADRAAVFAALSALVAAGRLVFPPEVVKELKRNTGSAPDDACRWAVGAEAIACQPVSHDQAKAVLAQVPQILDPRKDSGEDEADPYVLALAVKLRDQGVDARVVVQEVRGAPAKMSLNTACGMLGVPSVPLLGLLRVEKIPHG
jgi:hypothetical protein